MGLKLLILCALVVLNQAAKLPNSQTATCARQCTESKKFGYETGKTYDYDYTSKVSTTIQGASEDKAGIDMAAKVHIEVHSKCDLVLKVSDVVLTESDPKSPNTRRNADVTGEFKKSLEQNPLMFSFQDGRVDELCPSNDEQTWALNIKRAIISAFQNSMDDFSQEQETKEMDVTGSCDVNYSLASNGWYTMTIKKTKDTLGCVDRHGYKTAMQGTPYRVPSEIQSMPLVKSTHECQQGISKTGILQSSSCEEQHVLRPFSRESMSTEKRTTLAFEHAFDKTNSANAQKEVVNNLKEFCELSKDAVKVSTAKQFTELVRLMKTLDSDSMESVHKKVHSGKVCPKNTKVRKFFLDAIPMVGTKASLKMMTHLINTDEVTGAEADMWMTSLSFIQHPTKDMLLELKIIRALRAFGNAGFSSSITMVTSCLTRKENPTEVRLAAAQAFRRMACDANRNELMTIYSNRDEDSEIRIAAYLGLMTCPSKSILNKIQTTLESEEVNQVGSFVWTHLTNLMETSSPLKQSIKSILSNDILKKEFNLEKMKYSRNYEASFFLEKLNTGAAIDSNLIWSSKSFLPRSAMTNLTVDLFGHSVNLFEFGGRVEGLEYFLESYFGPEGYFGKSKDVVKQSVKGISNKAMDKLNEEFGSTMEEFKGSMYLRIFGNELQYINTDDIKSLIEGQNFNILDFIINLAKEQDYSFTQSFMFLDTSLIIPTMAGFPLNISLDGSATIDLQASGKMDLRQIQSNPMTVSIDGKIRPSAALEVTSLMSVDAFVTKAGMKMVSSVNSASAVEGHLEIKGGQLFSAEWKTPDAKTEIFEAKTSFFTVHRDETREQKMITQNRQTKKLCTGDDLSHVTGLELCGEISYPNASLKADSPYFPLTGPLTAGVTLYKRDSHTSYKMEYKFGKTKSVVIANVGFNTPGSKVDREMRLGFNLNMKKHDIEMMMLSPWKKATFNGAVDTKQRQLNGKLLIDQSEYSVNAALASKKKSSKMIYTPSVEIVIPKKDNIKLDGTIEYLAGTTLDSAFAIRGVSKEPINMRLNMLNKKVIKSIKGSFTMDKKEEYSFETRMQTLVTKKSLRYSPFISVKTPAKLLMGLGGSVEIKYKKAAKVDLTVTGLTRSPMKYFVQLRDTGNAKQARYQTKMNIQSPILTTKGRSNIMIRPTSIITRTTFDYIIPRVARDKVTMNSKIVMKSTKKATSIKGNGVLTLKKMSHLNLNLGMNFLTNAKLTTSNFNVKYGANKKDMNKQISFSSTVKHTLAWRASDVRVSAQLQHPESATDLKIKGSHIHTKKALDTSISVSVGKKHTLSTSVFLKNKSKKLTSVSGGISLSLNEKSLSMSNVFIQQNNQKYTNDFAATIGKQRTTIKSAIKSMSNIEFEISNDVTLPERKPFTIAGQLNRSPRDFKVGAQIGKSYILAFTSQYKPKTLIKMSGDVKVNSRRVTAEIEAMNNNPQYTGVFDVKWDADKDESKRIKFVGDLTYKNSMDVNARLEHVNPFTSVLSSYNHKVDINTQGHFDIFVGGKEEIALDLNLKNKDEGKAGTLRMQTPVTGLVQMNYDLMSTTKQYQNSMDITWQKSNKIGILVNLDKPFNANKFHGIVTVKTPFKGFQMSSVEVDHEYNGKVKSMLKTELNNEKVKVDINYSNEDQDVNGVISVKSSLSSLRTASVSFHHKTTDNKYQNALAMEHNGKVYQYEGQMNHRFTKGGLKNKGKIVFNLPNNKYDANWDHSITSNELISKMQSNINGKSYELDVNGRQAITLSEGGVSFNLKIKSPLMDDILLRVDHQHRPSLIDSSATVSINSNVMMSGHVDYKREAGKVMSKQSFKMSDIAFETSIISEYARFPMSGQINMKLNDNEIDASGTFDRQQNSQNGKLKFRSPFTKPIVLSIDRAIDGEQIISSSIEYGKTEVIAMENRFRWDNTKIVKISVVTPIESVRKFETLLKFDGGITAFKTVASLEIEPTFRPIQMTSEWNSVNGLNGKIRLETPFQQIPYSQISLVSKPTSRMTSSDLVIEYLPRREIIMKSSYMVQKDHVEGSLDIKTPFHDMQTMSASVKHVTRNNALNSEMTYTCPKGTKYVADINYKSGIKKEGSVSLKMDKKRISVNGMVDMTSGYPAGFLKTSTPFTKDIIVDIKQKNQAEVIVTSGSLRYDNGKEISLENRFRWNDAFVFTTALATPYESMKTINSVIEAKGDLRSFSLLSSIEAEPITKKFLISSAVNTNGGFDGNFRIETPFEAIPYSQITVSSQRISGSTRTVANIEYLPAKYISVKSSHTMDLDNIDATFEIQTPFAKFQHASASIKHTNDDKGISSSVGIEYPKGNIYSIDTSVKNAERKDASITVKSPYSKPVSLSVYHQGKYPSMETHGELQYQGNQKHILDIAFNNKANFKSSVSYKCPSMDKISLEINHKGSMKQFNSLVKAQYKKGEPHQIEVIFKNLAKMQGSFTVKSAFMDDFKASFHHTGSLRNLKSHVQYAYGKMTPASADVALISGKRTKGSVKLSAPMFEDITMTLIHKGNLKSFRNKMNLIYSKKQKISTDFNFRLAKVMKATFMFVSPFKGYKKVIANVKHEGTWKSFKCDANIKKGKDVVKANMKTSIGSKFNWEASVETPVAGWKKMNAAVSHEGTLSNFKCHAEIGRGKQDMVAADIRFAINPAIDILLAAQTPFVGYKNVKASLSHQKSDSKIKSHAEITYFKKDTISADILINKPTRSVDISIKTPFKKYEKMAGSFSHTGSLSEFSTKMDLAANKDKYSAQINLKTVGQLSAEMKISTPIVGYQETDLSFTHSGSLNNFRSRANILFNKKKSVTDVSFNSLSGVEGQLTLQTPYTETVKATIMHSTEGKMKSSSNIAYGKQTILDFDALFSQRGQTFGTVSIKALKVPKMAATFEYEGVIFNNKATIQASLGKDKIIVETQMETKSDVSGRISISTPFDSAKTMYMVYSKTGPMNKMNGNIEAGINEQKITTDITISSDDVTKASVTLRTPFAELRNADVSIRFSGTTKNFDSHSEVTVNEKMAEADLTVIVNDRLDIRGSMKTPFTKDFVIRMNHDGALNSFKSSSDVSYGYDKISAQITTDLTNGVQIDTTLKTPFSNDVIFATSSNYDFKDFRSLSQLTYSGAKQHELEVTFSVVKERKSLKTNAQVTYNGKSVSGKVDFEGGMRNFKSAGEANYNNQKIMAEIQFQSLRRLNGQLSLKTPFSSDFLLSFNHQGQIPTAFTSAASMSYGKISHDIRASFNHDGSFKKFSSNGQISYNGKRVSADISFDATSDITGTVTLKSPMTDDIIVTFSHDGTPLTFRSIAKITYSGSMKHDVLITFNHAGSMMNFNTKGALTYNGKTTSGEIVFDAIKDIEGKLELKTPITDDIIVAVSNEGSLRNFKTCLKVTYKGQLQHDASLKFNFDGSMMRFGTKSSLMYNSKIVSFDVSFDATKDIEGKITLKSPFTEDMIVAVSHEKTMNNFKTCLKVTYSGELQHDASLTFNMDGTLVKFTTKSVFTYNNKMASTAVSFDTTNILEGRITVTTPWTNEIIVAFSNEGSIQNFKTCLKITYSGSLKHDASVSFRLDGTVRKFLTLASVKYNDKIASAEVTLDSRKDIVGKITLKTPMYDDVIIEIARNGNWKNCLSFVQITYNGALQHNARVSYKLIKKPTSIQANTEASYNDETVSGDISIETSSGIDGTMTVKSPWNEDITTIVKYNGEPKDFTAQLQLDHKGSRQYEVNIRHKTTGEMKKLSTAISASYNGKEMSFDGSYDLKDNKNAQMTFKSPFTKDAFVKISLEGTVQRFSSNVELSYGEKTHVMTSKFNMIMTDSKLGSAVEISVDNQKGSIDLLVEYSDEYKVKVSASSPLTDNIELMSSAQINRNNLIGSLLIKLAGKTIHDSSFSLTRRMGENQFVANLNAVYNSKNVNGGISIVTYNGIDAKMTLETPVAGYEKIAANFLYETDRDTITAQVNGNVGSNNVEFNAVFDKTSPFNGKINIKTPVSGLTEMSMNVVFNNNPSNFRLTSDFAIEGQNMYDLSFEHISSTRNIQGSLELKTTILEDIDIKYDISGSLTKSSSSFSASVGSNNQISLNTLTNIQGRQMGEVKSTLNINIAGFTKTAELELKSGRSFSDFTSKISGKIDNDEISVETIFKSQPSYEASVKVETPFKSTKSMSATIKNIRKSNFVSTSAVVALSPEKVYEMSLNYLNQNFRKMDIKAEVKTPVKGHELMRWVYRHGTDQVLSVFSNYECSTGIQITGDIKLSPRSINMDVRTPFQSIRSLSLKGNLERQNMIYSLDTSFEMNKKSVKLSGLVDLESRPMTTRIELKTPFNGLESSEINLSCTGDIKDLRATVEVVTPLIKPINSEVHIRYDSLLDMETTAILTTGFKSFERLSVSLVNKKNRNEYQTHVETSWNREKTISFDVSCDVSEISSGKHIKTSMSISTPFEALKTITVNMGHKYSTGNYMQSVFLEYNGKPLLDIDTSYSNIEYHTVSIVTRHPRPMNFRIGGHMEAEKINSDISLNWNTDKTDSNMNMEVFYSHSNNKCNLALRFVHPSKTIGFRGELKRSTSHNLISLDVNIDDANVFGYTYDCKHGNDDRDTSMKFRFPNRSIMFTNAIQNRLGSKIVTGAFFWDADGDQTKKVSVKGDITPSENGVDANVVLEMPSIGQDVKLDSNVKFNKGSVLFDGKTAFQYSKDSRKTLILSSRLEDLSSGTDTNYSFNLGIKHPYTTVDVEVTSLLESSVYKKMASVDVKYQTANKMAKNFGIMGEIDSLKKSIKMDLTTPIKSINIQGNVQTTAPYKVSIKNLYDNAKPVSADIVFDPSDASIDVNMNYDIDNPQNILHVNAKMSDESGITAEVFRDVDSKRVSDTLINLKLKTSKILHTRVHWNPDLLKTVKSVGLNKIHKYGNGINKALQTSWIAVEQEVQSKHRLIISAIKEDMKPYINFMSARVTELQKMRRNNDYYLNDIVGHFQTTQTVIRHQMKSLQYEINSLTKDMDWTLYNLYLAEITELVKLMEDMSLQYYSEVLDFTQSQTTQLSNTIEGVYTKYGKQVTDSVASISSNKILESVRSRLPTIPMKQMADRYNTVIYNARESINTGLIKTLPTPVYHMASSAYKYWEIEENIRSVFIKFVNFIKKDIGDEFSNIKDLITDVKKTKVTVYDPKKGHFEMDIYLPLEMKSFTEVKRIANPIENLRSYIPQSNPLPSLGDIWSHAVIPSFGAHAYIKGDHFTTFDGQEFDFNGRCSYVLARDFGKRKVQYHS
ncbi:Hypothetical predicted protein [Mytilus galloprovincialis]|uniref:Vitellogenin domain-containing protein n=1 Tax=Mytilus galloprovincialis TaxID=29158 RepID=A0A8B6F4A2_MYTGA|nr:Hypothetical predicted protein [Mytilus galloprovincialis]